MYTDILDQVTGGNSGTGRGGRGGGRSSSSNNHRSNNSATDNHEEIIVSFKAGRMVLNADDAATDNINTTTNTNTNATAATGISDVCSTDDDATTSPEVAASTGSNSSSDNNKENIGKKFHCVALPDRGEVRLVKSTSSSSLSTTAAALSYSLQWYNRTTESVDETIQLLQPTAATTATNNKTRHTFERISLPNKRMYELDRVYVWTRIPSTKKETILEEQQKPIYRMFWMQDADASTDETIVASVNQYFADVATAAETASLATSSSTAAATTSQVDALSSILENLGMPQTATNSATSMDTTTTPGSDPPGTLASALTISTTGRNQLTLADLQGAMASIQQQQQMSTVGPPLQDLINSQSIDAIMNNPEACQRLIQYLPEEQQSIEFLRDNLSSSSMQSTLRTLTQMLVRQDDDGNSGGYTEYSNIIANFQLDPQDGEAALLQNNNPIEGFLNCIIASVEKEKDPTVTGGEEAAPDDAAAGDQNEKEDNDDDGDVRMNE